MRRTSTLRHAGFLVAVTALAAGLAFPASSTAGESYYKAQFACNDRGQVYPLANARVELWMRGAEWLRGHAERALFPKFLVDTLIDVHTADDEGRVRMGASARKPHDFYLRVQLSSEGVRAKDWYAPWAWFADTQTAYGNQLEQDFGTQQVGNGTDSPECAAYEGVRRAYQGYRGAIGQAPSYGDLTVRVNSPFTSGVPLAPFTSIWWPPRYPPSPKPGAFETASHEFGHTVRHGFDGNEAHFLLDVARFNYLQHHEPCKRTNPEFAFNEGWAEYWAGDFGRAPNCPGIPATDYSVEGNVAAALTGLDRDCQNVDRKKMVEVLARNAGRIHRFEEFRAALSCFKVITPPRSHLPESAPGVSRRLQIGVAKGQLRALGRTTGRLARKMRGAERLARRPLPCRRKPCLRALSRAILPPLIGAQLSQARLLRKTLQIQTSTRQLKRLGVPGSQRFQRRVEARARAFQSTSAKLGKRAMVDALKAARPVMRRDRSPQVKTIVRGMRRALGSFRAGHLPAGFAIPTPTPGPSSRLKRRAPLLSPSRPTLIPQPPAAARPKPDLVIDRVFDRYGDPDYLTGISLNVEVRNAGVARAPASKTAIAQSGVAEVLVDTPALAPGASVTVRTECVYGQRAQATARADATNLVEESSEANNNGATTSPGGVDGICRQT